MTTPSVLNDWPSTLYSISTQLGFLISTYGTYSARPVFDMATASIVNVPCPSILNSVSKATSILSPAFSNVTVFEPLNAPDRVNLTIFVFVALPLIFNAFPFSIDKKISWRLIAYYLELHFYLYHLLQRFRSRANLNRNFFDNSDE